MSAMAIRSFETSHYRIPLAAPMFDATHGEMTHFEVVVVKVRDDSGVEGIGYTYTIGLGGVAIRSLLDLCIRDTVVGSDPARIEHLWDTMWWKLHYVGRGGLVSFAISAVDIALWDLAAKRQQLPLWKVLGGYNPAVRCYAGGIDLHLDTDELLHQTQANLDEGFRAVKMKVGRSNLNEDVERVAAVRQYIGPDVALMVDANMRWTVDAALRASHAFRDFDVYWLEEPIIPDDVDGHVRLAQAGCIPVATGENLHTVYEFEKLINSGGVSFPEPDVSNCCGITGWTRVARMAYARNLRVTTHGVHEIHLHLLAAIPNASFLEVHGFGLERFIRNPPKITEGMMTAGSAPGHGVEFVWADLDEYKE
jgi:L-alanine-DL-glutamate epimerase-like enolase superfamily enzyme